VLAAVGVAVALALPPIAQDPAYHAFADRRALLGVPNALDVLSNVVFLLAGAAGLAWLARGGARGWDAAAAAILFAGVAGTAVGSAWYHLAPDNPRLVWDRLPMSAVFTTLLAVVIADRLGARAGRVLLPPLLVAGVGSVVYWARVDDLRPYGLVQFFPMLAIPFLLLAFPSARGGDAALWWAGAAYAASKVTEHFDAAIFAAGGLVSGHTLKHVLAGAGAALIVCWIVRRPSA
jgi:hypothetical protein